MKDKMICMYFIVSRFCVSSMTLNASFPFSTSMLLSTLAVSCTDASLGRLNYDSLSDQTRMEILLDGLSAESKERFQDKNGNFLDVCDIGTVGCDDDENVTIVHIPFQWRLEGQIDLAFIPPHVTTFSALSTRTLGGTVSTDILPQSLKFLILGYSFSGTFDMKALPPKMEGVEINSNTFCGSLILDELPENMKKIRANNNKFTGCIDLSSLPAVLEFLWINKNQLCGEIFLEKLPPALQSINLSENAFTGRIELTNLPEGLIYINVGKNALSGTAVLQDRINGNKVRIQMGMNMIQQVVNEKGKEHRFAKRLLKTQKKS